MKTVTSKEIEEVSPVRTIYDCDYRNLADGHVLGAGDNLSRKAGLVQPDALSNVRRDPADVYGKCNMFWSINIKDIPNVFWKVMRTGKQALVLFFALQNAVLYSVLLRRNGRVRL